MINFIGIILQIALPFVNWLFRRAEKKRQMKKKMFQMAERWDKHVLKNARLKREYDKLKEELKASGEEKD